MQRLKPVARRNAQIGEVLGDLQLPQFPAGDAFDERELGDPNTCSESFGAPIAKRAES